MLWGAKNGSLRIGGARMDYAAFGRGERTLILIPGLGDGLRTVRGLALPLAATYRAFAKTHRVLVFSRRDDLAMGCTTRDMARDVKEAMDALGIARADVLGVSQGGMIAQHLAADEPQAVDRLVLAVTAARANGMVRGAVDGWMRMVRSGDYAALMIDTAERTYTERYLRKMRPLYPLLSRLGKPQNAERFLAMAEACRTHDARENRRIAARTLVIGGRQDRIVGPDAARELAGEIPGCELYEYEDYGHGLYEEAKDFNARVLRFLLD